MSEGIIKRQNSLKVWLRKMMEKAEGGKAGINFEDLQQNLDKVDYFYEEIIYPVADELGLEVEFDDNLIVFVKKEAESD